MSGRPEPTDPQAVVWLPVALSAAAFGVLGACLTLPGTLLPLLVDQFGIRLVEAGSMLAFQPIAYLLSVLVAGRVIRGLGMRIALCLALLTSAVGFAGFGMASNWMGGAAMMFVSGLGFGIIEVGTNTLLIQVGGERRANLLNLAHMFFGVGSFIGPVVAAHAVAVGASWRAEFAVAGVVVAAVGLSWTSLRVPTAASHSSAQTGARAGTRSPLAFLLGLMLSVYVGVEMGIGAWLTKYMVVVHAVSLTYAGNALSLYWLGLTVGRVALSLLSHRVREETLLSVLTVFAAVTLAVTLTVGASWAAVLGFAATGAGFSGIFPSVIALGGRHHPHDTAGATSIMIAGAGLGGIVIPWTMSAIADLMGLTAGMAFYAVLGIALVGLSAVVRRALPA